MNHPCTTITRITSKKTQRQYTTYIPSKISLFLFVSIIISCVNGFNVHEFDILTVAKNVLIYGCNGFDNGLNFDTFLRNTIESNLNVSDYKLWSYPLRQPVLVVNNIDDANHVIWDGIGFDWDINNIFEHYLIKISTLMASGMCIFFKIFCCS